MPEPVNPETAAKTTLGNQGVLAISARRNRTAVMSGALDFDQEVGEFLFAFGLVLAGFGFGELGDVHGAEFGPTHGAELGFLVKVVGERFVVHGLGGFGVERKL